MLQTVSVHQSVEYSASHSNHANDWVRRCTVHKLERLHVVFNCISYQETSAFYSPEDMWKQNHRCVHGKSRFFLAQGQEPLMHKGTNEARMFHLNPLRVIVSHGLTEPDTCFFCVSFCVRRLKQDGFVHSPKLVKGLRFYRYIPRLVLRQTELI